MLQQVLQNIAGEGHKRRVLQQGMDLIKNEDVKTCQYVRLVAHGEIKCVVGNDCYPVKVALNLPSVLGELITEVQLACDRNDILLCL